MIGSALTAGHQQAAIAQQRGAMACARLHTVQRRRHPPVLLRIDQHAGLAQRSILASTAPQQHPPIGQTGQAGALARFQQRPAAQGMRGVRRRQHERLARRLQAQDTTALQHHAWWRGRHHLRGGRRRRGRTRHTGPLLRPAGRHARQGSDHPQADAAYPSCQCDLRGWHGRCPWRESECWCPPAVAN